MARMRPEVAAIVADLDPTLRPILEFELKRRNRIRFATRIYGFGKEGSGITLTLSRPLDLDAIEKSLDLDRAVEPYVYGGDPHNPSEAGYLNREKRQALIGPIAPSAPVEKAKRRGPIAGPPSPRPWNEPSPFWPESDERRVWTSGDPRGAERPPRATARWRGRTGGKGLASVWPGESATSVPEVRRSLKIAFAILVLLLVGLFVFGYFRGSGRFLIVAPRAGPVTVRIDGDKHGVVRAGRLEKVTVEQGNHTVDLVGPAGTIHHAIAVESGMFERILPVAEQCFVEIYVTAEYERGGRSIDGLEIVDRYVDQAPFSYRFRPDTFHSPDDLPGYRRRKPARHLLLEFSCALADAADKAVLTDALAPWL